eukprot:1954669-Rhodomonas_salina.1
MQGPTAMPEFNAAGYNTSHFAYPQYENGRDVYYNQYHDIERKALVLNLGIGGMGGKLRDAAGKLCTLQYSGLT